MHENTEKSGPDELQAWVKQRFDVAVRELIDKGVFGSLLVEAKPAWVWPFQVLIGKVREHGSSKKFKWLICGEVPTDFMDSATASTPREAARYFAMKWQLEAARQKDLAGQDSMGPAPQSHEPGSQLVDQAEALYELADDAVLWQQKDGF